jgi:hypothetical protein
MSAHAFHLRLRPEIYQRVKAKAAREGRTINRVIENELLATPELEHLKVLGEEIKQLKIIRTRFEKLLEKLPM